VPVLVGCLLTLISCQSENSAESELNDPIWDSGFIAVDTVIKDLPGPFDPRSFAERDKTQLEQKLHLKPIENGYDSLQIRILIDCWNEHQKASLIILQCRRSQWRAVFYSFTKAYSNAESGGNMDYNIAHLKVENKLPQAGWKDFTRHLFQTGVLQLKDYTHYANYFDGTDANWVTVEIATARMYRFFSYPNLGYNTGIKEGPGQFHQALKLIEKEFNYTRPCEDSTSVD
jgi:hypothetical protein